MAVNYNQLSRANRESGDWLPRVSNCSQRCTPCGNPACADSVMHGAQILATHPGDVTLKHTASYYLTEGIDIANKCPGTKCPIDKDTENRKAILVSLFDILVNQ